MENFKKNTDQMNMIRVFFSQCEVTGHESGIHFSRLSFLAVICLIFFLTRKAEVFKVKTSQLKSSGEGMEYS